MCINAVTRLREDILPDYHSIKRHYDFEEYFVPDRDPPSYSWNAQTYTSLLHSLLVELTNDTCVKSSMAPQYYKILNTHTREISVCTILSILIHSYNPNLGGVNVHVRSDLATLALNNGEKIEYSHRIIIILQKEIILSGETVSTTKLLFQ